jgi:hypothetical protein
MVTGQIEVVQQQGKRWSEIAQRPHQVACYGPGMQEDGVYIAANIAVADTHYRVSILNYQTGCNILGAEVTKPESVELILQAGGIPSTGWRSPETL